MYFTPAYKKASHFIATAEGKTWG